MSKREFILSAESQKVFIKVMSFYTVFSLLAADQIDRRYVRFCTRTEVRG